MVLLFNSLEASNFDERMISFNEVVLLENLYASGQSFWDTVSIMMAKRILIKTFCNKCSYPMVHSAYMYTAKRAIKDWELSI